MTKKKTASKKPKTLETARGSRPGPSPDEGSTPRSDTLQTAGRRDPRDGTATIAPVTIAMLDQAAHEAAGLTGDIARHAVDRTAAPAPAPEPTVTATVEPARDLVEPVGPGRSPDPLRVTPPTSGEALRRYNTTLIAMMRSNAASMATLFAALIQARSVPEALSINADHLRRQVATLTDQGTELAGLAQRIAGDTLRSLTDATTR